MATKSVFKRFDAGTSTWVEFYFRTSADIIDETTSFKVMTAAERTAISTYLTGGFNAANKLLQLDSNGLVPAAQIPTNLTAYLKTNNPAFTGTLTGPTIIPDIIRFGQLADANNISGDVGGMTINGGYALTVNTIDDIVIFNGAELQSIGAPTAGTSAATKAYVDSLVAEGVKPIAPVVAASTANIATLSGLLTIDGIVLTAGQRVLVKNQTTVSQNGIYTASATAWTKVTLESVKGSLVFVEGGTVNNDSKFYAQDNTTWILFSRTDTVTASTGLTKVGLDIRVATGGITNAMLAGSITWDKISNYAFTDNITTYGGLNAANGSTTYGGISWDTSLASAIKLLRGTAAYNTDNTQTIAGAYTLASAKNATFTGSAATPTGTFTTGDLYFQTL
jgi:hypothetical protein